MQYFDRGATLKLVSDLEFTPANRRLIDHWLSLWCANVLPDRDAIRPGDLKQFLSNLIMFDVVPDRSVVVRLAGTAFSFVLGTELTGRDWIELAPSEYRAERLRVFSDIAVGAIGRGVRSVEMNLGDARSSEEILLPFRGAGDGDVRLVLCHVDLNLGRDHLKSHPRRRLGERPWHSKPFCSPWRRLTGAEAGAETR